MKELLTITPSLLTNDQLSDLVIYLNKTYREGYPAVSDADFDSIYLPLLASRIPDHPLVTGVQPEEVSGKNTVTHTNPMLSTDKAYTLDEVKSFIERCKFAAQKMGLPSLMFRVLPKLDGLAASYVKATETVATRGDGLIGNNISAFVNKGVVFVGDASDSAVGELVIKQSYFAEVLSGKFKHPRNFVAGISGADKVSREGLKALSDGAINLVLFKDLPCQLVNEDTLINNLDELCKEAKKSVDYLTDGTVIEVENMDLRNLMGHNDRHHHWQIAKKSKGETAEVKVIGIEWSVGRNKITPVLLLEPTLLSGAMISRVTAHNAGNVKTNRLGAGSVIELVRSGEVIPFIAKVIQNSGMDECSVPNECPCCKSPVVWDNDFIVCNNSDCPDRLSSSLEYHFKLIGADLFGAKTCRKLVDAGFTTIGSVHSCFYNDFIKAGFGAKQAENLSYELNRIKSTPIKDNLVLASLGINTCGRGTSKTILKTVTLNDAHLITYEHLMSLKGFAETTSSIISKGIAESIVQINFLINTLNIVNTKKEGSTTNSTSLAGLSFVFTGSMPLSRDEMKEHAEARSGTVQSSVSGKTSFLVIGDKVGAKKISDAQSKNVQVITVDEYFAKAG